MLKYYKNLIKRKKYGIFISICIILILFLAFYYGIFYYIINNLESFKYEMHNNGLFKIIAISIVTAIYFYTIYYLVICKPMISPYAQDHSDFDVKSEGKYIRIKFRNDEFLVEKETFQSKELREIFPKGKNKHSISDVRRQQIYNYVMEYCKEMTEAEVDKSKTISKSEVVDKFSSVRKMTNEEKLKFIKQRKLKNKPRLFFIITSIILWSSFSFLLIGLLSDIMNYDFLSIIVILSLLVFLYVLGRKSNIAIFKDKKLIKRILNEDMYIVLCEIYDKHHRTNRYVDGPDENKYYIKITDGNYIVDQWIEIPKEKYIQENNNILELYVFDKNASDYFLVC